MSRYRRRCAAPDSGRQLVAKAIEFARETELRVVPICSYARAVIQRDPAMSPLLVARGGA